MIISTQQLTRRYGRRVGIDRVDLDVPEGSIFGFLGPNGAGKTTTIRVLLGFLRATEGSARVLGQDCWANSHVIKRDIGYVPGDLRLYPWMTATSALEIVGRIRHMDLTSRGRELADRFRLEMGVRVRNMSRGMRQKLGIILALAHQPRLLILDEPTSGLDPLMQDTLADVLRERAAQGDTVFFSSHTLSEVEQLCERVAIVRDGRIVADETLQSLRDRAHREVVLVFNDVESAASVPPPPTLTVLHRDGVYWRCDMEGAATQLLDWTRTQPLRDLTISPPDLESLFRQYYKS